MLFFSILLVNRFVIKNWGQSVHFDQVISCNTEYIRLAISQPIFRIETFG